ncbi:plant-specific TFIIB-related protein 1 [Rhododendron vialii]|uniref:plant-specific TFIIB-related protein 1 n=1 Tax=Rhododendron vialii TaxID=182163 RepID=UPI00265DE835|nr:plant-specific TFIIB-related protein 1 [Rhododendron vialii]
MRCPYCSAAQGRCATTPSGRSITECTSCGRVVEERHSQSHHLFHLRALDSPLCLVTSDLPSLPTSTSTSTNQFTHLEREKQQQEDEEDPFEPTGFITAFSTWSLEPYPVFAQSSLSFAGHLAELERVLETTSSSSTSSASSSPSVVVDNLRAYLQIIDVSSILGLDCDISDHAFQLFRDCSSATCLRNRSVEALATAALVQAIREAQEPRTLQEISIAANLPQKEIGKYIKILGEALQLSQPINSNSISVHMPRFCTLLQLNKSAQELATHIGEVVINKCFCTRRNPISISAAAIYLACQLEDKRKTQAEICKVTGLTEVTLRKVYKELLENWDDLLPPNYTPAVPPEKAFPTTTIASSGRSSTSTRIDILEATSVDREKSAKPNEFLDTCHQSGGKEDPVPNQAPSFWQPQRPSGPSGDVKAGAEKSNVPQEMDIDARANVQELEKKADKEATTTSLRPNQFSSPSGSAASSMQWPFRPPASSGPP